MADKCNVCGRTEEDRALSWDMSLDLGTPHVVQPCCGKSQKQIDFEREMDIELLGMPRDEFRRLTR